MESIRIQDLENASYVLGRSILWSGYPLSMVDTKDMQDARRTIANYGIGLRPPSYHTLHTTLLDKA